MKFATALLTTSFVAAATALGATTITLYDQDFEAPAAFNNDGADVSIFRTVNENFGDQPPGFSFTQAFTVETLNITGSARGSGSAAFGTGYSDPDGRGGNFALGMLSDLQNDRLNLRFDIGDLPFFNLGIDVSSIDLSSWSGPFTPLTGIEPQFQFTLYDQTTRAVLDRYTLTGTASERATFDWTSAIFAFDTAGKTGGGVDLEIDLLSGGYAAMDNFLITASDEAGDLGGDDGGGETPVIPTPPGPNPDPGPTPAPVPLPASLPLLLFGAAALVGLRHRRARA